MNKVILIGRLTRDPELRFAPNTGNAVVRFTLAVNRRKQKDKDKDKEADFINCVAFGKTAETIAQYLLKGNQIAVEGNIRTGSYDKDGIKRYTTDVLIEKFNFIGNNKSNNSNQTSNLNGFDYDMTPVDDGDMPF